MGWNHLSIPKLQRYIRGGLGMDWWFHFTLYNGSDYLSVLGLELIHGSKRSPRSYRMTLSFQGQKQTYKTLLSVNEFWVLWYIDGILPKWPYPPCFRMADRALLAGYPRYIYSLYLWTAVICHTSSWHARNQCNPWLLFPKGPNRLMT